MSLPQTPNQFIYSYGYYGLFAFLVLEGLGLPLPVQIIFMATAYLIRIGAMSTCGVIIISTFGNLFGNIIAYYVGYRGGERIFEKLNKFLKISKEDITKIKKWFEKYGSITNLVSRWIGITRTPAIWVAGVFKINFLSYTLFSFIGDLIWTIFWVVLFNTASPYLHWLFTFFSQYSLLFLILIFIAIYLCWHWFYKIFKQKGT